MAYTVNAREIDKIERNMQVVATLMYLNGAIPKVPTYLPMRSIISRVINAQRKGDRKPLYRMVEKYMGVPYKTFFDWNQKAQDLHKAKKIDVRDFVDNYGSHTRD